MADRVDDMPEEVEQGKKRRRKAPIEENINTLDYVGDPALDPGLAGWLESARGFRGSSKLLVEGAEVSNIIGIPFPALCLEYLYQSNVYPLGRSEMLAGVQGTNKSCYLYDHYRWFKAAKGVAVHVENENKDDRHTMWEILDHEPNLRVFPFQSDSMDDWIGIAIDLLTGGPKTRGSLRSLLGPNFKKVPVILGVDSFFGKLAEASAETIFKDRCVKRTYSWESQAASRFLKAVTQCIRFVPFAMVGTNHDKISYNEYNQKVHNITGGYALRFQDTIEILMEKLSSERRAEFSYNRILFEAAKNSAGRDHTTIIADIKFGELDPETGQQQVTWDWDTCTTNLLIGRDARSKSDDKFFGAIKRNLDRVREIVDINEMSGNRMWSKALNVPQDDSIDRAEMGRLINQNEELRKLLRPILGVRTHKIFKLGELYAEQMGMVEPRSSDDDA